MSEAQVGKVRVRALAHVEFDVPASSVEEVEQVIDMGPKAPNRELYQTIRDKTHRCLTSVQLAECTLLTL